MSLVERLNVVARGFATERVTTAQARSAVPTIEAAAAEIGTLRAENERLRRVYGAANVVVAVLGCHGEICARDDRVSALMDALHNVDGGVPNARGKPLP